MACNNYLLLYLETHNRINQNHIKILIKDERTANLRVISVIRWREEVINNDIIDLNRLIE